MRAISILLILSACSDDSPQKRERSIASAWPVAWVDLTNSAISEDVLRKTGGQPETADSGARSQQTLSGDGWFAFTVDATEAFRFVGLTRQPGAAGDAAAIDFAFRLQSGRGDVYENGSWRADNTVVAGDVLKIARESGTIRFFKNDLLIHEIKSATDQRLTAQAALIDLTSTVAHARITIPAPWQPPQSDPPMTDPMDPPMTDPPMADPPTTTPTPSPSPIAHHRFCGWTMATGYVTPDQDPGYLTFAAHADDFDAVHPAWWHLGADTNTLLPIYGEGELLILMHTTFGGARTLLIPMVAAVDGNQPQLIHQMLYDAAARQSHIQKLVALAVSKNYDGLDLDYEHLPDSDRDAFSQFAREVAAALHASGKTVSFAVQALTIKSSVWDYDALSAVVDQLHVMGYDFHGLGSPHPGPVAPLGWIQAHAAYVQSIGRTQKFILGLPNYSIGGPEGSTTNFSSTSLAAIQLGSYATTTTHMASCSLLNPGQNWSAGRAPNIVTSAQGHVYFDDIASMEEKVSVAQQAGYGGITYWTIGGEPDRPGPLDFFQMVRAHFPKN